MTCCPRPSFSLSATKRAVTSIEPPGENPTTIRTGLAGKLCADAPVAIVVTMKQRNACARKELIGLPLVTPRTQRARDPDRRSDPQGLRGRCGAAPLAP